MAANQNCQRRVITATFQGSNTVDLAILQDPGTSVSVTNDSGTAPIWFTVSHPGGTCPVPVMGGTSTYCAASVAGATVNVSHPGQFGSVVQLISSGTPAYTVAVTSNPTNA